MGRSQGWQLQSRAPVEGLEMVEKLPEEKHAVCFSDRGPEPGGEWAARRRSMLCRQCGALACLQGACTAVRILPVNFSDFPAHSHESIPMDFAAQSHESMGMVKRRLGDP